MTTRGGATAMDSQAGNALNPSRGCAARCALSGATYSSKAMPVDFPLLG
eukprot:CAMPEP_0169081844 /NCGR_PEP_ID=MMETSP1015-20121227/11226_1 /TAXON_ID=342587 /ORGANISM="Karlodinium micrum, Strain CCMP2283" /LENGTH=48 /DNA_ID= /DNA_START= /DNA_END= /DNA_ORIENTATION=